MPQLVGSVCVICQQRIGSILEGKFCKRCDAAVHNSCVAPDAERAAEGHCPDCGANVTEAKSKRRQEEQELRARLSSRIDYPVSRVCPECGHAEYTQRRPERWVAFTKDRICKACGTRYTPPTPTWAAVVLILAGLPLTGFGALSIFLWSLRGDPIGLPAVACEGFLGLLGILAIVQGIRSLIAAKDDFQPG